jgi:hypothetical protein
VKRLLPSPDAGVKADWLGWISEAKQRIFKVYAEECETFYTMLSVSLNEAICLREYGALAQSFLALSVIPALTDRLTGLLIDMLRSLKEHAQRYRIAPRVAPLQFASFQGRREKRSAVKSFLLNQILPTQRAQFLSKIRMLQKMVAALGNDFSNAAAELASHGAATEPAPLWAALDTGHFDLNTCLRESMVLLRCFLRSLPDDQLVHFQETISTQKMQSESHPAHRVFITITGGFLLLRGFAALLEPEALSLLGLYVSS